MGSAASSPEAQAFLDDARAQKDIRARIVAGAVLSIPVLNNTSSIYIRPCFQPLLWDVLSVHEMKTASVGDALTGTPGVGKSTLAVLAVYVALACKRDVAFWNGQKTLGHVFCGGAAATFDDHPAFLHAARRDVKSGGLFVYDTFPPPEFRGAQTLLVTAPKFQIWKEFAKFGDPTKESAASLLVFPTCSEEDIRGMAPLFAHRVPTWEVAYAHLGGVPRLVFRPFDSASFARSSPRLLQDVEKAFSAGVERTLDEAGCKLADVYVHFRTLGQASEAGEVDEAEACVDMSDPRHFAFYDVVYASPKAQEVVESAACILSDEERHESLAAALQNDVLRRLAGGRFESFVHERLAAGVNVADGWQCRVIGQPVGAGGAAFSVPAAEGTYVFGVSELLTTGAEHLDHGFYLRPISKNQAAIDAIIQGRTGLAQMSIASRHGISSSGLAQVLPLFPSGSPPPLYIFVPPKEYALHYRTLQPITGAAVAGVPALTQIVVSVPVKSRRIRGKIGGEGGDNAGGSSSVCVGKKRGADVPAEQAGSAGKRARP